MMRAQPKRRHGVCCAIVILWRDSHQHHFEERAVFAGRGVRAVGTNETNVSCTWSKIWLMRLMI